MQRRTRAIGGKEFWLVGSPQIQRDAQGHLLEYLPEVPIGQRMNRFATGPFCKFGLPTAPKASGVYAVFVDEQLKYIGRCEDLHARFGASGYGSISPRNLHHDGQSTNCKLNARVLSTAQQGQILEVWFHSTPHFVDLERQLIDSLSPEWNGPLRSLNAAKRPLLANSSVPRTHASRAGKDPSPTSVDFDAALRKLLDEAASAGLFELEVRAGELHRLVGGYPGSDHRMPSCCARMEAAMRVRDRILYAPPKGKGASLCIAYRLPRF